MSRIVLLSVLLFLNGWAIAGEEAYNRVDFEVEVARELPNDLLIAVMGADIQDVQPARLSQRLNTTLNDALKKSAAFKGVKASSGNQHTYPVYGKDNQIDAWRGHAEIRLESRDFKEAGELIMHLQSAMQLGSVQFSIAPDTRAEAERALIADAIKAFQARADAIRAAFGATSYKMVRVAIKSGKGAPPFRPNVAMRAALAEPMASAPEFAAGDSRVSIQVSGAIEMQ